MKNEPALTVSGSEGSSTMPLPRRRSSTASRTSGSGARSTLVDAEPPGELGVADGLGLARGLEREDHAEHEPAAGVALEDARAVVEQALLDLQLVDLAGRAIHARARRRARRRPPGRTRRRSGSASRRPSRGCPTAPRRPPGRLSTAQRHERVPVLAGLNVEPHAPVAAAQLLDPRGRDAHDRAREALVGDDDVAAAGQHEQRLVRDVGFAHERHELALGRRVDEPRRRAAEAQRRQLAQRRRLGHAAQASGRARSAASRQGRAGREQGARTPSADALLRQTTLRVDGFVLAALLGGARSWACGCGPARSCGVDSVTSAASRAGRPADPRRADGRRPRHDDARRRRGPRCMDAVSSYPIVHSLRTSTDFPHKLRISSTPTGRSRRCAPGRAHRRRLRRHDAARQRAEGLRPRRRQDDPRRRRVSDADTLRAIGVWRPRRRPLRARVERVFHGSRGLAATVQDGPKLYFGGGERLRAKWSSAAQVLAHEARAGRELHRPARSRAAGRGRLPPAPGNSLTLNCRLTALEKTFLLHRSRVRVLQSKLRE